MGGQGGQADRWNFCHACVCRLYVSRALRDEASLAHIRGDTRRSVCVHGVKKNGRRVIENCLRYATADDGLATLCSELLRMPASIAGKTMVDTLMRVRTKPGLAHYLFTGSI